ncbi:hypothetical protein CONPUDRAFT_138441 [Coniophora puteana RWD-64-598 SS2]|uniref:Large ribosomal subunit protein uL23m n=1 Tax=Coniophora puteana (strain RWD-64-598) TaxID=741705 RepID=A0A5M3MK35_CONPW|nr:uncharacterized protein CONPUDRAFT_138441 [Coniophora puteana RWD-64-598 SS2]EIW79300.1 hypothetical protein CONPUDRAFT_138441 [Coniophora puteana RWD-64-598 SS2]
MQALTRAFRRLYSTHAETTLPELAAKAREESTPLAVRARRRLRKAQTAHSDLSPTEQAAYARAYAKGTLLGEDGAELTEAQWLDYLNGRRSRQRGMVFQDDKSVKILGQPIYLPNIIFRLVRNHTPKGEAYNPYEATFRVPHSLNKTDIRSYLSAAYGLRTTYIRTANYLSPLYRNPNGSWTTRSYKSYKKAVVGLVDPFYYPKAMEDMKQEDRREREKWLDEHFATKTIERWRKLEYMRMTQKGSKGWHMSGFTRRDHILKAVASRRAREQRDVNKISEHMAKSKMEGKPAYILQDSSTVPPESQPSA